MIINTKSATMIKFRIILSLFLLFVLSKSVVSNNNAPHHLSWQNGEVLSYKVKWSFIRLGTLRMEIGDTTSFNGFQVHRVRFHIDSNPMLFFVNMHNTYESLIDDQLRLHIFYADENIDDVYYKTEYEFNYEDSLIQITMTDVEDTTRIINKELPLQDKILDGTSMITYTRAHCYSAHQDTLISLYEAKLGNVAINFHKQKRKRKLIDGQKIETFFVDGTLMLEGIAGVTGPFKGWFSTDPQHIPLHAELKVFVGSVKIDLESWKNWKGTEFNK